MSDDLTDLGVTVAYAEQFIALHSGPDRVPATGHEWTVAGDLIAALLVYVHALNGPEAVEDAVGHAWARYSDDIAGTDGPAAAAANIAERATGLWLTIELPT